MYERLTPLKQTLNTMTDYMTRGEDTTSDDPFDNSPFSDFHKVSTWSGKAELIDYAERCLRALERNGSMTDDEMKAAAPKPDHQVLQDSLWAVVAPVVATADSVEWNGAFSLTPDAPDYNSDEWRDAAAELEIPDSRRYELVPKAVSYSYRHLEKINRWNDEPRPCHTFELKSHSGVHIPDRRFEHVWDYLAELPGVNAPDEGHAWEHVETDETSSSESAEGGEVNA